MQVKIDQKAHIQSIDDFVRWLATELQEALV